MIWVMRFSVMYHIELLQRVYLNLSKWFTWSWPESQKYGYQNSPCLCHANNVAGVPALRVQILFFLRLIQNSSKKIPSSGKFAPYRRWCTLVHVVPLYMCRIWTPFPDVHRRNVQRYWHPAVSWTSSPIAGIVCWCHVTDSPSRCATLLGTIIFLKFFPRQIYFSTSLWVTSLIYPVVMPTRIADCLSPVNLNWHF